MVPGLARVAAQDTRWIAQAVQKCGEGCWCSLCAFVLNLHDAVETSLKHDAAIQRPSKGPSVLAKPRGHCPPLVVDALPPFRWLARSTALRRWRFGVERELACRWRQWGLLSQSVLECWRLPTAREPETCFEAVSELGAWKSQGSAPT